MSARFEYTFVRLRSEMSLLGVTKDPAESQAYHEVIRQHATDGWRLATVYSPPSTYLQWIDLIFERPTEAADG